MGNVRVAKMVFCHYLHRGRIQGSDWGGRRPHETYESNFTRHDYVQFR